MDIKKEFTRKILGAAVFLAGMAFSGAARADCEDGGLGTVMCNIVVSSEDMPGLFSGACYLFGVVIGALAIAKLYEHVINPNNVPIWDAIKRIAVSGALGIEIVFLAICFVLRNFFVFRPPRRPGSGFFY